VILAVTGVLTIGALAMTWIFAGAIGSATQSAVDAAGRLADAFKPQVNIQTTVRAAVGNLDPQLRLKVAERELEVTVEDLQETRWLGVPLGSTVTQLRSSGNLVQYVVPLDGLTPERMEFIGSDGRGALLVHLCAERMQYRTIVDCHHVQALRYDRAQLTQQNFKDGHVFKDRGQYDHAG
jgi:hypothetical protein